MAKKSCKFQILRSGPRMTRFFPNPKGSIMIWTLLLGLSLATVFFFFAQILNMSAARQQELMEYQAQEAFVKSYAHHLESLSLAELEIMKGNIEFQGISGTLTNETRRIEAYLDAGETSEDYLFSDAVKVQWNECTNNFKTDMTILDSGLETNYAHAGGPSCPSESPGFDDELIINVSDPFQIKSTQAPFGYRIESTTPDTLMPDNIWYLNLEFVLSSRKKIRLSRSWTP